ncbi:hypothetical protein [Lacinutrix sp.]|uniref:hypothetical protein n=1 Tax=Lacinutrix sp. TaxID=1937692 RepID=UPI0030EBCD7B
MYYFIKTFLIKIKPFLENECYFFLNEINIDGVNTEIEELDEILIASSGIIPVFGFPNWS